MTQRSKAQLRAIHARSKGYVPVINIANKNKQKVFVGELIDKDTIKLESPTKREAFEDAQREAFRRIEKEPKGTIVIAGAAKASVIANKGVLSNQNYYKNNPVQISLKINNAKGKNTKEAILVRRKPGKKLLSFNPKLKKSVKGRKFINFVKKEKL